MTLMPCPVCSESDQQCPLCLGQLEANHEEALESEGTRIALAFAPRVAR